MPKPNLTTSVNPLPNFFDVLERHLASVKFLKGFAVASLTILMVEMVSCVLIVNTNVLLGALTLIQSAVIVCLVSCMLWVTGFSLALPFLTRKWAPSLVTCALIGLPFVCMSLFLAIGLAALAHFKLETPVLSPLAATTAVITFLVVVCILPVTVWIALIAAHRKHAPFLLSLAICHEWFHFVLGVSGVVLLGVHAKAN